ncbi:MAG: hypothetical protein ABI316_11515 [Casimicrobiaceae bacterium]
MNYTSSLFANASRIVPPCAPMRVIAIRGLGSAGIDHGLLHVLK